jgi:uncharacterized membrane protein YtjA (UPF0391 family)
MLGQIPAAQTSASYCLSLLAYEFFESLAPISLNSQLSPLNFYLPMLYYAVVFLVIALIAAFLGFAGIAGTAAWIAKVLFVVFLILAIISFIRRPR